MPKNLKSFIFYLVFSQAVGCVVYGQNFFVQGDPAAAPLITPEPAAVLAGANSMAVGEKQGNFFQGDVTIARQMIESPSFELSSVQTPESFWRSDAWIMDGASTEFRFLRGEDLPTDSAMRGLRAADGDFFGYINNREKNDARFLAVVAVTPGAYYRLSGFVAAAVKGEGTSGATLGIFNGVNTTPIRNTGGQWVPQELFFRVGESQNFVEVALRLGFFGADVQGEAAFDDVRLELVQPDEIPAGVAVLNLPQDEAVSVRTTKIQAAEIARKATPVALLVGVGAFVFAAAATLVLLLWLDGTDSRRQEERSQRLEK